MEVVSTQVGASNWIEARDTLRQWRDEKSRKSSKIVELGSFLLENRKQDLGNEGKLACLSLCLAIIPLPFLGHRLGLGWARARLVI